jgi:hypothetical protein
MKFVFFIGLMHIIKHMRELPPLCLQRGGHGGEFTERWGKAHTSPLSEAIFINDAVFLA